LRVDVQKKLDQIVAAVEAARSMPMSASCVVNRAELLAMLGDVRAALPDSLSRAEALLGGREEMVEEARAEADRIIEQARAERGTLVSETEIARHSRAEADRILAEARREAEEIRAEADDYVDSKLANFEVVLTKTIGSVDRGREKLLGHRPADGYDGSADYDEDDAPERSADPETLRRRADDYVDAKLGAFEAVLSKTLEAVGRGRLKLTGHRPIDELGAHLAAADTHTPGAAHPHHQSDDEYLAGLAGAGVGPAAASGHAPGDPVPMPAAVPAPGYGGYDQQQPAAEYGYDPAAVQQQGAERGAVPGYEQSGYEQHGYEQGAPGQSAEPGFDQGYDQNAYAQPVGYADPYATGGYGQDPAGYADPGYAPQQPAALDPYGYPQDPSGTLGGHPGQQLAPQAPGAYDYGRQPAGTLDETSFFDTGMIDLDRLRELEQGR
jgi:cell division septum initiation protein DivIVA